MTFNGTEFPPSRELPWTHPRDECAPFGVESTLAFPVEEQRAVAWCWCGWHSEIVRGPDNARRLLTKHVEAP